MISAYGNNSSERDRALLEDDEFGRARADVGEADAEFALVGAQHRVGGGQRFEDGVIDVDSGFVHGGDYVLRGAGSSGDEMHTHFKARGHHAERIVDSGLIVENKFLREQVKDFAIGGKSDSAGALDGLLDFIASDFAGTRAQTDAAVAVDAAHMGAPDSDNGVLHRRSGDIFRGFDRFLN